MNSTDKEKIKAAGFEAALRGEKRYSNPFNGYSSSYRLWVDSYDYGAELIESRLTVDQARKAWEGRKK